VYWVVFVVFFAPKDEFDAHSQLHITRNRSVCVNIVVFSRRGTPSLSEKARLEMEALGNTPRASPLRRKRLTILTSRALSGAVLAPAGEEKAFPER
jgi:hypothetical protein